MPLQATKNKTYTPKNICSSVSKDCSHEEYLSLVLCYVNKEGGGVKYNENNFKKKKKKKKKNLTKEQFKLKYRNQSKKQTLF